MQQEWITLDQKVQTKGKRGAKGEKHAEVAKQETKEGLPAENGRLKTRRVQCLIKQERRKPSLINIDPLLLVAFFSLVKWRGIFLSTILLQVF